MTLCDTLLYIVAFEASVLLCWIAMRLVVWFVDWIA